MNKKIIHILLALMVVALAACTATTLPDSEEATRPASGDRVLRISLTPSASVRAIIKDPNSKGVIFKWNEGHFDLNMAFKQGDKIRIVRGVEILQANGEECTFEVALPKVIDEDAPFDLYGVVADDLKLKGGKLLVNVGGRLMYQLNAFSNNNDGMVPVYFKAEGIRYDQKNISAEFEHLGSLAVVHTKNTSTKPFKVAGFAVRPADNSTEFYHKAALPFEGNTTLPYLNLLDLTEGPTMIQTYVTYPEIELPAGHNDYIGFWFRANTESTPEVSLVAYEATERKEIRSINTRPARSTAMQAGKAYNLYAEWNGTELKIVDPFLPEFSTDLPTIKIQLNEIPAGGLPLAMAVAKPEDQQQVWIDLNGNGAFDLGEAVTEFQKDITKDPMIEYKVTSKEVTIYGRIDELAIVGVVEKVAEDQFTRKQWVTDLQFSQDHPIHNLYGWFGITIPHVDFSTLSNLQTLQWYNCGMESITLPSSGKMETLAIEENKDLTRLDLTHQPNLRLLFLSENGLTAITSPAKFTALLMVNLKDNKLEKDEIEGFVTHLNKGGDKFYPWMYSLDITGNPGANDVDESLVTAKKWTLKK